MKRTAIHDSAIHSILAPVSRREGAPKVWPVLVRRGKGRAEPAILHEIGGQFWVEDQPRTMPLKEAWQAARELAEGAIFAKSLIYQL